MALDVVIVFWPPALRCGMNSAQRGNRYCSKPVGTFWLAPALGLAIVLARVENLALPDSSKVCM
jgi:hypothetical protein